MATPEPPFTISIAGAAIRRIEGLLRQAATQGRGKEALAALKEINQLLVNDAANTGEPLYGLYHMQLEVRTVSRRPLVVDFAVHLENRIVFVQGARLLGQ